MHQFIGLQIYSIGVCIGENGVTSVRYLGIMFIIFETMAIFFSIYKEKKYLLHILTVAIILTAISTILPIVNMQDVSNINQAARLRDAWQEGKSYEDLTDEEKSKAESAYRYIRAQANYEKYIPEYLSKEILEDKIIGKTEILLEKYNSTKIKTQRVNYEMDENEAISVQGYSSIKEVSNFFYDVIVDENGIEPLDSTYNINITNFILEIIEENKKSSLDAQNYISNNRIIDIDTNIDLYIKRFDFSYELNEDEELLEINYINIEGYIMIK